MNVREVIKLDKATISLVEDGIVCTRIHANVSIEMEDVKKIKEANESLAESQSYCVLVQADPLSTISKEARELSASKSFQRRTLAKAIMINNLGQHLVSNFYIRVNRPHIKTKIFRNQEKAIKWLRSQL